MHAAAVGAWFDDYLSVYAALGRGDMDDPAQLLDYYSIPLLITTDEAVLTLTTAEEVVTAVQQQISGLQAAGYERSETLTSELSVLNERTALYAAEFSRRRADGSEIQRLAGTYLITAAAPGCRIAALIVCAL